MYSASFLENKECLDNLTEWNAVRYAVCSDEESEFIEEVEES